MSSSNTYVDMPDLGPEPTPTHYCRYSRVYPVDAPRTMAGHTCQMRETALGLYIVGVRGRKRVFCHVCDHHERYTVDGFLAWPLATDGSVPSEHRALFNEASRREWLESRRGRIKTPDYLHGWCRHPRAEKTKVCLHQLIGTLEVDAQGGGARG